MMAPSQSYPLAPDWYPVGRSGWELNNGLHDGLTVPDKEALRA